MANKLKIASYGHGIPLVFIHGWGLNAGIWEPVAQNLKEKFKIITIDLPGYGKNVESEVSPYTLDNVAKRIVEAVGEPAVYIGWSLGGLVANNIALNFARKTLGLVNIASTPFFLKGSNWPGIEPSVLNLFHRQLEKDTQKTIDNFLKIQAMGSPHIRQDIKVIRELIMQYSLPSKTTLEESLTLLETTDQRLLLRDINCAYLRMYGRLDGLVPKAAIKEIDMLAPNSVSITFDQASHAPFISDTESFTHQLSLWIDSLPVNR